MSSIATEPIDSEEHLTIIEPNRNWIKIDWKSLWKARDLIFLFIHRDFVSKYKQTILGPAWFVIQPLLTSGVFMIIQFLGNLQSESVPMPLFNLCSLLAWQYFANILLMGGSIFLTNAELFKKVYFQRLAIPLAQSISHLLTFGVQATFFALIYLVYHFAGGLGEETRINGFACLFLPLVVTQIALLGLGVSFLTSCLTAKYRDMNFLLSFGVQMILYLSPVIYSIDTVRARVPEDWAWLVFVNPLAPLIEYFRYALLNTGQVNTLAFVYSAIVSVGVFIGGLMLFQRTERTFVDKV
ncbi:ABC transporter permease [Pelagicoccus albus]|uniref:ABC transporter permease n=1 Tax=Pelagicoccus albus TaxID=415222 RepID=A0A7X1E7N7_9BACT|nr:ABC transporter permease [Pelagicoccus albus]MBC2605945.1 ABC transporter permease [Pelagicoccus albus]